MAIKDWGSPKLAAMKMLSDELFPLAVCNTLSISFDNPNWNIALVCINPNREILIKLTDDGKVVLVFRAEGYYQTMAYELVDPKCSLKVLSFVLENDAKFLKEAIGVWNIALDRFGELKLRVDTLI